MTPSAAGSNSAIRDAAAYPLSEAARYARLAPATLRSWVVGRTYPTRKGTGRFQPLIRVPLRNPLTLSFNNLIESHVLRALRTEHGVPIRSVRAAIAYAERELNIEGLLLRRELCTNAGELLLDRYGQLINLSKSGQLAMKELLKAHLRRVEWDKADLPYRLFPFMPGGVEPDARPIAIDAAVAFGRPVVVRRGVTTAAIADRVDAGETVAAIAADYQLRDREVEEAVLYERAA